MSLAPLRLLALPQEIQDLIFDFAYPAETDRKFATRQRWDRREEYRLHAGVERGMHRHGPEGYKRRRFGRHVVSKFLVNKQYFAAATRAWVRMQTIDDVYLSNRKRSSSISSMISGVVAAWVTDVSVRLRPGARLTRVLWLPNLKKLTLVLTPDTFRVLSARSLFQCREALSRAQIKELAEYYRLHHLAGLREVKFLSSKYTALHRNESYWHIKHEAHTEGLVHPHHLRVNFKERFCVCSLAEVWEGSALALEAYVTPLATRERTAEEMVKMTGHGRIYPGSRVAAVGSTEGLAHDESRAGDIADLESFDTLSIAEPDSFACCERCYKPTEGPPRGVPCSSTHDFSAGEMMRVHPVYYNG